MTYYTSCTSTIWIQTLIKRYWEPRWVVWIICFLSVGYIKPQEDSDLSMTVPIRFICLPPWTKFQSSTPRISTYPLLTPQTKINIHQKLPERVIVVDGLKHIDHIVFLCSRRKLLWGIRTHFDYICLQLGWFNHQLTVRHWGPYHRCRWIPSWRCLASQVSMRRGLVRRCWGKLNIRRCLGLQTPIEKVFGCLGYFSSWTCLGRDFCALPLGDFEVHVWFLDYELWKWPWGCTQDIPKICLCSACFMKVKGCRRCFRPPKTLWIPFTFSCSLCC